ncbi:hypothetical protein QC762_113200 [Podospora pseudocomata]|uniref:Tat pathway signal sequence n=1 Tax=Podospora pseudocomata TaxID=2093779 RepID=A0ABR0GVS5_9PEZI|nr:hypothetical protein QC762_113200 [Podospora pseudocomata]
MMSSLDEKPHYTPLLSQLPSNHQRDHDEESLTPPPPPYVDESLIWKRRFYTLLVSSVTVILSLTAAFTYHYTSYPKSYSSTCPILPTTGDNPEVIIPFSPAPVTYTNKFMNTDPDTSKFLGEPRPELDKAWHDLLDGTLIYFSEDELKKAGNAVSISREGGGYVGGLGVSHSLHCLKRIKQYLHPTYYYPDISTTPGNETWSDLTSHVDHCLESLRQLVLCTADTNVYTLHWTDHSTLKPSVKVPQPNVCVDWKPLHRWMKGRGVGFGEMVHPASHHFGQKKPSSSVASEPTATPEEEKSGKEAEVVTGSEYDS